MKTNELILVFAYGTLKKGFEFHYCLKGAALLAKGKTKENYSLYLDDYPIVCFYESLYPIEGEIYQVTDAIFAKLDSIEDYPKLYIRKKIPVILESGEEVEAWIYYKEHPSGKLLSSGKFKL